MAGGERSGAAAANAAPWLSQAECERRLGLVDWGRCQTLEAVQDLISGPPFVTQLIHSNQVATLRAELRRLRPATRVAGIESAARQLKALVARYPEDPDRLKILAGLLEAAGGFKEAEQRWREVTQLLPQASVPYLNLARLLEKQNQPDEAALAYETCLRRNPDTPDALGGLGELRLQQGRVTEAVALLRDLARQQPNAATAHWLLGRALWQAGRKAEANAEFQNVVQIDPHHAEARHHLNGTGVER